MGAALLPRPYVIARARSEGAERLPRPAVSRAGRLGRFAGSGDYRSPEPGDSEDWPDLAIIPGLQKWWALGSGRRVYYYILKDHWEFLASLPEQTPYQCDLSFSLRRLFTVSIPVGCSLQARRFRAPKE